jgi:hypothetical protein
VRRCGVVWGCPDVAYMRSLTILQENVEAELDYLERLITCPEGCPMCESLARLRDQLAADCREVKADIEQLIEGGEF